jgi:hypothetical protein
LLCYTDAMPTKQLKHLLERAETWPEEDQDELAELARDIEARRSGVYHATDEELRAIDEADQSGVASGQDVEAAFRSFRRA